MTVNDTTPPAAVPESTPVVAAATPVRSVPAWLTPVLAIVAALVIGLFGGILIGKGSAPSTQQAGFQQGQGPGAGQGFGQNGGQPRAGQPGGAPAAGRAGGGFGNIASGTIESIDGTTITIKEQDGTMVTVTTSGTTVVTESTKSTVSGLKSGQTISVRGAKDASGNVAATSISEGAAGFGGRGQR